MAPTFTEDCGQAHYDYVDNLDGDWEEVLGEERMSDSADFTRWNPFETLLMHPTSTEGLDREMCSKAYYEVKFVYHCLWQLDRHRDPKLANPAYSPPRIFQFMWRCLSKRIHDHDDRGFEDKAAFNDTLTAMSDFVPNCLRVDGFLYFHPGLDMVVEYLCLRLGYFIKDMFRTLTRDY
ncbi:MAG: hypothetical protein Q9206_006766, partial [Seirophora lacunosa]